MSVWTKTAMALSFAYLCLKARVNAFFYILQINPALTTFLPRVKEKYRTLDLQIDQWRIYTRLSKLSKKQTGLANKQAVEMVFSLFKVKIPMLATCFSLISFHVFYLFITIACQKPICNLLYCILMTDSIMKYWLTNDWALGKWLHYHSSLSAPKIYCSL